MNEYEAMAELHRPEELGEKHSNSAILRTPNNTLVYWSGIKLSVPR